MDSNQLDSLLLQVHHVQAIIEHILKKENNK